MAERSPGGESDDWEHPAAYDVASLVRPGANVLAVRAVNTGRDRGVLAVLRVVGEQGEAVCSTGRTWRAGPQAEGWTAPGFREDSRWGPAVELGPPETAPWHLDRGFGQWLSLRVQPPEVTPNGDGVNDRAIISYVLGLETAAGVQVQIRDAAGALVWSALGAGSVGDLGWDGMVGGRAAPRGTYTVQARPADEAGPLLPAVATASASLRVLEAEPWAPVRYRARPFFPIGVWFEGDPRWAGSPGDPVSARGYYERCFADLNAHGFNCVAVPNCPQELWGTLLAAAARHQIKVVLEARPLVDLVSGKPASEAEAKAAVSQVVKAVGKYPALLRYQIRDEPPPQAMPNWLLVQRALALADPTRPAFSCFNNPASLAQARRQATLSEAVFDIYPHGVETQAPSLGGFLPTLEAVLQAAAGLPPWAVLQSFAKPQAWRYPTPAELSAVTWLSLASGAKGVFFFIYQTMPQHPERLEGLVQPDGSPTPMYGPTTDLARAIGRLAPMLLGLRPGGTLTKGEEFWAGRYLDPAGKPVLIVASVQPQRVIQVRLPVGDTGRWRDALSGEIFTPASGILRFALAPGAGRVLVGR